MAVNEVLKEAAEVPEASAVAAVGDVTMPWLEQASAPLPRQVPVPGLEPWPEPLPVPKAVPARAIQV